MRARILLASIMKGIIKTKVSCVAVSEVLAHGFGGVAENSGGAAESRKSPYRLSRLSQADQAQRSFDRNCKYV